MADESVAEAIRRARPEECDDVARLLAAAFASDPVMSWLLRRDERQDSARALMFRTLLRYFGFPGGEVWLDTGHRAASLWVPPARSDLKLPWWQELALFPAIIRAVSVTGLKRMDAFRAAVGRHHPKAPHWYLMTLGVDPAMQGKGLGGAMLRATLAEVDRQHMPAYLESSSPRNVPLYERFGFVTQAVFNPPPDGPPLWAMWREARIASA
ncbi:MAG: GNAT family N-acetyltransferase [Alphaproteobacteria bacterium]|nr:GNAT family N-acetyltransferase [Alphaproteobacteria bacterium]